MRPIARARRAWTAAATLLAFTLVLHGVLNAHVVRRDGPPSELGAYPGGSYALQRVEIRPGEVLRLEPNFVHRCAEHAAGLQDDLCSGAVRTEADRKVRFLILEADRALAPDGTPRAGVALVDLPAAQVWDKGLTWNRPDPPADREPVQGSRTSVSLVFVSAHEGTHFDLAIRSPKVYPAFAWEWQEMSIASGWSHAAQGGLVAAEVLLAVATVALAVLARRPDHSPEGEGDQGDLAPLVAAALAVPRYVQRLVQAYRMLAGLWLIAALAVATVVVPGILAAPATLPAARFALLGGMLALFVGGSLALAHEFAHLRREQGRLRHLEPRL